MRFDSILVVCVGNICRSPLGEALLQRAFPARTIASAGLAALVGHSADARAQQFAAEQGLDLRAHRARQLTAAMCQQNDLILVMEKGHIDGVCRLAPQVRGKVMLFAHWLPQQEIADPYRKSDAFYAAVYTQLESAARAWIAKLT